jgi:very-short-patch-repair endonuclease
MSERHEANSAKDPTREKAVRLFSYLSALAELRAKTVRDVASYEAVFGFGELPREEECYTLAWDGEEKTDEENWLRIDKTQRPVLSRPPVDCEHWFDPTRLEDNSAEPKLYDEIVDPQWISVTKGEDDEVDLTPPRRLLLSDHPNIPVAWRKYLETKWRPWRAQYERWDRIQSAYRKLFAIYQEQQRRGEQYELRLGVGVLLWTTPSNQKVRRPIVTARVTISLQSESGCITIAPAVDGANFTLEQDMIEVNERPPIQDQREIEDKVSAIESPWNRATINPILKGWLHTLPSAADAIYHDTLACPDRGTSTPQMAFAPTLILRKRGAQAMREMLKKIVKGLNEGKSIPCGIRSLCGALDESEGEGDRLSEVEPVPEDILFPLPTNDEQLEIIRRLSGRSGVLVQGPPGTGKSHTIVNLVSYLLARGQRVLVTSQTPRALKVLRDKIPASILPLTVSLLGEDAESRQNLEYSVQGILRHVNTTNPAQTQQQIVESVAERRSLQSTLAALRRREREVREAETTVYSVPGTPYQGTAQAIALALSGDSRRFSWLTDAIGEGSEPPLTDEELRELDSLWVQCRKHPIDFTLPLLGSLPVADNFEKATVALSRARDALASFREKGASPFAKGLCELGRGRIGELWKIAQHSIQVSVWLANRTDAWISRVRQDVFAGRALTWSSLESTTSKALESLAGRAGEGSDAILEAPAGMSRARLLADANDLVAHLESGRGLGFWIFRVPVVKRSKYLWRDTRFDGRRCDSPIVLNSLIAHLRAQETLELAWQEWRNIVEVPDGTLRYRVACLEQCRNTLRAILQLSKLVSDAERAVGGMKEKWKAAGDTSWAQELLGNAKVAIALLDVRDAQIALSGIVDRVVQCRSLPKPHPIVDALAAAAEQGNERDYRKHLERLAELQRERTMAERCLSLDRRLRESAPTLADAVMSIEKQPTLVAGLASFSKAWAWKRAAAWLERFVIEHSSDVGNEIARTECQLHEATKALVALRAWNFCREKLARNREQQGALIAWQQTVKKIGKGTGKHAETHRRDARKYMQQCRNAIPAWIMPLHRVAEQVEAEPEIFDVVIVDESSQTGPEGLILQYLAKQCVIVGDDKQISPEGGFIDGNQVRILMEQHLDGIPFSETLDPATSLFDQVAIRYGNRITLREHFRCMPEIIRFSNGLCYADTPLIPLRQYPASRLPPIQVRFVTDGFREGKSQDAINRPEAAAVAKTVVDCLCDPRYNGRSFGVICLQGHAQAQLIENMILEKVGPEPFKDGKTRLLCGDPYSFQGDERDIVFLSMIASVEGDGRSAPLTRETFRQRFNVAASRPRDQVWLFHSIRESELHPDCMRRRLVNYYYNPSAAPLGLDGHGRAISKFQQDVGEALRQAGFRLISEFEVAGRFIDWVVEDKERRLAIECDGDVWHGPDRYEADMLRQRILERCGWRFIRIRGSVFYANQSKAIEGLIRDIREHGLEPYTIAEDEAVPRDWVQEISGKECMESLGTHTIDTAEENIVQQRELFPEESGELGSGGAPSASEGEAEAQTTEQRSVQATTRSNLVDGNGVVYAPKPEDDGNGIISTGPTIGNAPSTPKESAPESSPLKAMSEESLGKKPIGSPAPRGAVLSPPMPLNAPTTVVTEQERNAVFKALDEAAAPLIMWQIGRGAKIGQQRIEEIIPVLVREGFVKRIEAAHAVMYRRA